MAAIGCLNPHFAYRAAATELFEKASNQLLAQGIPCFEEFLMAAPIATKGIVHEDSFYSLHSFTIWNRFDWVMVVGTTWAV